MNTSKNTVGRGGAALPVAPAAAGFPLAVRVGDTLYLGSHTVGRTGETAAGNDAIESHTRTVFEGLVATLNEAGLSMSDLTKLHTYYVFEGEGTDVTRFWQRMTKVRLEYLANPGPAATALRVNGAPVSGARIAVDGVAACRAADKRRLMPAHTWDWSMPTPFSQGWLVGDKVYVGGQVSADMQGRAVAQGEVVQQTRNVLEYIRHVLLEAGSDFGHLVSLKIGYRHAGPEERSRKLLSRILDVVREVLPTARPPLVCFGVDLLYEGLLLEIDALGSTRSGRRDASADKATLAEGFPAATRVGDEVHVGSLRAGGDTLAAQASEVLSTLDGVLGALDCRLDDLVKLNVYYVSDTSREQADRDALCELLAQRLPRKPALALVRVAGLPHADQRVQLDAVAVAGRD